MSASESLSGMGARGLGALPSFPPPLSRKQRRQLRVQFVLEVHVEQRSPQGRQWRRRQFELSAKLVEEHSDQAEGAFLIENSQANVGAARRLDRRQIELFGGACVVQTAKRATVHMTSELSRGRMNRGGKRARAHDVDLPREARLRDHLS